MIPNGIARNHLLEAVKALEKKGYPERFQSTKFDLLHDGKRYPPKQVVRYAAELAGVPIAGFSGGAETNKFLRSHGFEVVAKRVAEHDMLIDDALHERESIRPTEHRRVMDLVQEAGHDIADWANFAGADPSRNPRYCYEWCFSQPARADIVCLWFENISEKDGRIHTVLRPDPGAFSGSRKSRVEKLEARLVAARATQAPLRVILLTGLQKPHGNEKQSVEFRRLDPIPWHVLPHAPTEGTFEIRRGPPSSAFFDQFDLVATTGDAERRTVTAEVHLRSESVRRKVLMRAGGRCEFCGTPGFVTPAGHLFLETHHVVPLSENGPDHPENVIALCPNHHREAHYGVHSESLKKEMIEYLTSVSKDAESFATSELDA